MSDDVPSSKIPKYILDQCKPAEAYMLEQISILNQKTDKQTDRLIMIEARQEYTNGKIAQAIKDIDELKVVKAHYEDIRTDVKQLVGIKRFADKWIFSRKGIIITGIFLFGLYNILVYPGFLQWLSSRIF